MCKTTAKLCIQSLAIKGRNSLSWTRWTPQWMTNCPQAAPRPRISRRQKILERAQGPDRARTRSRKRPSLHTAFSDAVSGASHRTKRVEELSKDQTVALSLLALSKDLTMTLSLLAPSKDQVMSLSLLALSKDQTVALSMLTLSKD